MKNFEINITPTILRLVSGIDKFNGSWEYASRWTPEKLSRLRKVATIESIGSSTRIEGVKLSNREIENLLFSLEIKSFKSRDEEEVAGYADAMNLIYESYQDISLTENHIKQLHTVLLKYSSKDQRHHGEYKKLPNHVEAFDPIGKSIGVVFKTATPFDTPHKMTELLSWTTQIFQENALHPILVIATFIVHFLAIHPFQDGNGRLSRVLTTLLLLRSGYSYVPYASMEALVEENKNRYYLALRKTQETIGTENYNIEPWLLFFMHTLEKQKNILQKKLDIEKALSTLPILSQRLLNLAQSEGQLTIALAVQTTGANRNTIKAHVQRLLSDGYLEKQGIGKGTWYRGTTK